MYNDSSKSKETKLQVMKMNLEELLEQLVAPLILFYVNSAETQYTYTLGSHLMPRCHVGTREAR